MLDKQLSEGVGFPPNFALCHPQWLVSMWPHVQGILLAQGKRWLEMFTLEEVFAELQQGRWELWVAGRHGEVEGIAICAWERRKQVSYYHVLFVGGVHLETYLKLGLDLLEKYACLGGAKEIVLEGRRGWLRILQKYGFCSTSVKMRKPVKVLWRN